MIALYVLDTDHLTLLQRNHPAVIARVTTLPPEGIAATVVSAMEQVRGRLAQIHRAKTASEVVMAFARFQEALTFYRTVPLLSYDEAAATHFARLRQVFPSVQAPRTSALRRLP
jgi:tRNA(fMet)-specific endonuclease VapC